MSTAQFEHPAPARCLAGYRLWKVPGGSALDWEYVPYTLTNTASDEVALRGVGLDDLADWLMRSARPWST